MFFNHSAAQCVRSHTVNGADVTAGPDLSKVVTRHPEKAREFLLESLVSPNAKIAAGFAGVTLILTDGRVPAGFLVAEDAKSVTVQSPDGRKETVAVEDVEKRTPPLSAMPSVEKTLTPRETGDLIEYLMTLK